MAVGLQPVFELGCAFHDIQGADLKAADAPPAQARGGDAEKYRQELIQRKGAE